MRVLLSLTVFSALFVVAVSRLAHDSALTEHRKIQAADRQREAKKIFQPADRLMAASSKPAQPKGTFQTASGRVHSVRPW